MKKLNFMNGSQKMTKEQMKQIKGGELPSTQCYYHCCDGPGDNCGTYVTNGLACSSAADCAVPNDGECDNHLYWSCH